MLQWQIITSERYLCSVRHMKIIHKCKQTEQHSLQFSPCGERGGSCTRL